MSHMEHIKIFHHNYSFFITFHMIFHDFPCHRPDFRTLRVWKMWTLNNLDFHDNPGSVQTVNLPWSIMTNYNGFKWNSDLQVRSYQRLIRSRHCSPTKFKHIPQFHPERLSYNTDAVVDIHSGWWWIYKTSTKHMQHMLETRSVFKWLPCHYHNTLLTNSYALDYSRCDCISTNQKQAFSIKYFTPEKSIHRYLLQHLI